MSTKKRISVVSCPHANVVTATMFVVAAKKAE
jgi:hypothetical protein